MDTQPFKPTRPYSIWLALSLANSLLHRGKTHRFGESSLKPLQVRRSPGQASGGSQADKSERGLSSDERAS